MLFNNFSKKIPPMNTPLYLHCAGSSEVIIGFVDSQGEVFEMLRRAIHTPDNYMGWALIEMPTRENVGQV